LEDSSIEFINKRINLLKRILIIAQPADARNLFSKYIKEGITNDSIDVYIYQKTILIKLTHI